MDKDFFLLDIPVFEPDYEEKKVYGHSTDVRKRNTLELLTKTSKGYCMYCFNRIVVNGNNYAHIEHGIEKFNSEKLVDCLPNLGLACSKCNQSYKSRGEKERKLTKVQVKKLDSCTGDICKTMCNEFSYCRKRYTQKWKIILQPFGVENRNKISYKLQFNLLTGEYIENQMEQYSEEDRAFIKAHIDFFGLNDVERRNKELGIYCKNVIDERTLLRGITVNHLVVELFREKLQILPLDKAIKVCETVYVMLTQVQYV